MTSLGRLSNLLLVAVLALGATPAGAMPEATAEPLRKVFLAAENALKNDQTNSYQTAKQKLGDYPLYPYLEFQELRSRLSRLSQQQAARFLADHKGTPLAVRFRHSWLKELAKRGQWQSLIDFYQPTSNSNRHCDFLNALIRTGRSEEAWPHVEPLWLSGRSRPDACDPVFKAWREAGKLTEDLVWRRIALAMEARQTRLANYLGRFLDQPGRQRLQLWLDVHNNPGLILEPAAFERPFPYRQAILLHGLQRMARKDAETAYATWRQLADRYPFDSTQRYKAQRALALGSISQQHPLALERLQQFSPDPGDTRLLESRLRAALSQQDWQLTLTWLDQLPATLRNSERWRYWRARSLSRLGREQQALEIYQGLAVERSYYGFLAADRVEQEYNLDHTPLNLPDELQQQAASNPGLLRARELYRLGRLVDARREWHAATGELKSQELQAAASLAQQWGWHDQAIFTLARSRYWEDLELRFPLAHRTEIDKAAGKRQLDNAWIFAVLRQESAFAADARSPAGAMGLMQLMPRTARSTARKLKRRSPRSSDLLLPKLNIELGTAYLKQVLSQLNGNPVLATAAYNAGPHRVSGWLPEVSSPADLWIETIPYKETRRYTQRVLTYAVIYDQRLGKRPKRMQQRMPRVTSGEPAPELATRDTGADRMPPHQPGCC